jgi:hypothetical protein
MLVHEGLAERLEGLVQVSEELCVSARRWFVGVCAAQRLSRNGSSHDFFGAPPKELEAEKFHQLCLQIPIYDCSSALLVSAFLSLSLWSFTLRAALVSMGLAIYVVIGSLMFGSGGMGSSGVARGISVT